MMQVGTKFGMCTMKDAAYNLFNEGIISQETVSVLLASSSGDGDGSEDNESSTKRASKPASKFSNTF